MPTQTASGAPVTGPDAFGPEWSEWLSNAWHFMGSHIALDRIVKLCPETEQRLYPRRKPARPRYREGARPVLELLLSEELAFPDKRRWRQLDRALHLAAYVHHEVYRRGEVLRRGKWSQQLIEGGTEEEVVALDGRTGSFECSRLLACLLQMRGTPARLILLFADRPHEARVGVEAYLEAGWRFLDVKFNAHYVKKRGGIASAREIAAGPDRVQRIVSGKVASLGAGDFHQIGVVDYAVKLSSPWKPGPYVQPYVLGPDAVTVDEAELCRRAAERSRPRGRIVRTSRELKPYQGWACHPPYLAQWKKHSPNEPPVTREAKLCAETADYLYSKFTPTVVHYRPGSRPALEGLLHEVVLRGNARARDDGDFLRVVWDWVWINVRRRLTQVAWPIHHRKLAYFGTEEDIASFRSRSDCYCSSRMSVALLQVGGLPARLIHMFAPGAEGNRFSTMHTAAEAWVGGKWVFFDSSCHDYAVTRTGEMASFWELASDVYCQTEGLRLDPRQRNSALAEAPGFDDVAVQNCPIADSTRHYRRLNGSAWFTPDTEAARRTCRFGI